MDGNRSTMSRLMLDQNLNSLQVSLLKRNNHASLEKQKTLLVCCKKRRGKEALDEPSLVGEKWKNLDPNILREIFCRLPIVDLFLNVSSVCQSWEATCWDFMFWSRKVFDMSATGAGFGMVDMSTVELLYPPQPNRAPGFFGKLDSPEKYNIMAVTLMRKLRRIMETEISYMVSLRSWKMSLSTIILPYDLEISDKHLFYIAERTPCVQHLLLLCPSKITVDGLKEALKCWKHLKGIHLGLVKDDLFAQFLVVIGANSKEIESLHLHLYGFKLDERSAPLIALALPGLKKLELEFAVVKLSGITSLYNMCPQLEEVHFNRCQRVNDIDSSYIGYERPVRDLFRLTWTTDETVFVKWEVTPCFCYIQQIGYFRNDTRVMKYLYSPQFLEEQKARLQPKVESWLLNAIVAPIRRV